MSPFLNRARTNNLPLMPKKDWIRVPWADVDTSASALPLGREANDTSRNSLSINLVEDRHQ